MRQSWRELSRNDPKQKYKVPKTFRVLIPLLNTDEDQDDEDEDEHAKNDCKEGKTLITLESSSSDEEDDSSSNIEFTNN